MKQLVLDLAPPTQPLLDNFVVGPNAELLVALHSLLDGTSPERFLYIWGGAGCGKSHLVRGMVVAAKQRRMRVCQSHAGKSCSEDEAEKCDVVLVDDVLSLDEGNRACLFNVMNRLRDGSGMLIATGPFAPMHLRLRRDLATRLAQGLVYQVKCLSDQDKTQAMMAHAKARGFILPREVAAYLLKHWQRDLPSLISVLSALDKYSLEMKRPITVPLVREALALVSKT